jgi:hypothetical protein
MTDRPGNLRMSWLAGWSGAGLLLAALSIPLMVAWVAQLPPLVNQALPVASEPPSPAAAVQSSTQVLSSVRQLKLLTVQIDAAVRTTAIDERWRGTATAMIEAPARFHYGIDLGELDRDAVQYHYLTQTYTLAIPEPHLIAVEVDLARPLREEVRTSGLRMDVMSGQKQMILAQRALHEHAQLFELPPEQRQHMRQATLEQAQKALGGIGGPTARVIVRYAGAE